MGSNSVIGYMEVNLAFVLIFLSAVSIPLAAIAQRRGVFWPLLLIVFVLAGVAGVRGLGVGNDTAPYLESIRYYFMHGEVAWGMVTFSRGYGLFTRFLMSISGNPTFLLLTQGLITNALIISRIWDYREVISLPTALFAYLMILYPYGLCLTCQMLAVSIFFYSTRWLKRGSYLYFAIGFVLSVAIHKSAIIGLFILIPHVRRELEPIVSRLGAHVRKWLNVIIVGIAVALISAVAFSFSNYFRNLEISFGMMIPARLAFLTMFIALSINSQKPSRDVHGATIVKTLPVEIKLYYFALALASSSYFISNAGRISYYFACFGPVAYGWCMKRLEGTGKRAIAMTLLLIGMCVGFYLTFIENNSMEIANYAVRCFIA